METFYCLSSVWTYIYNMIVKFETYGQKDGLVGKGIATESKDLSEISGHMCQK